MAAFRGNLDAVKYLADRWIDVSDAWMPGSRTALHEAAMNGSIEVVAFLVEKGADVNAKEEGGRSVRHYAVLYGNWPTAKWLIEHGADVLTVDGKGNTLLYYAANHAPVEAIPYLVGTDVPIDAKNEAGETALVWGTISYRLVVLRALIRAGADRAAAFEGYGDSALGCAARAGSMEIVRFLVEGGSSPDEPDVDGWTPLLSSVAGGSMEIVSYLLESGADPNATACIDGYCTCPALIALERGDIPILDALIGAGAAIDPERDCELPSAFPP